MSYLKKLINKYPQLRDFLLRLNNLYFEYRQFISGSILRNPAYFRHVVGSRVLAGPGTLNYRGGVFNPGSILHQDEIFLLAKSQTVPWYKARGKRRRYYLQGDPVIIKLDRQILKKTKEYVITDVAGLPEGCDCALEDFRLFTWGGKTIINHSMIFKQRVGQHTVQGWVSSALSVLDHSAASIRFLGIPTVDFEIQNYEKNWVYKQRDEELILFYSLNPYRVLKCIDAPALQFKTIIYQELMGRIQDPGGHGNMVSFSTNPIDFNDKYWLMVIHQINDKVFGRCYYHWAILIEKATLYPVQITSKSIFSGLGARGRKPGIRYISSILKEKDFILFFAGEGDVYTTVTKRKISDIESLFVNLH